MSFAFLNTRGWNEGKWRTLIKEGEGYDVIGVGETGWHNRIQWQEGGWLGVGRGRKVGEKRGGGVGILVKEKTDRNITEISLQEQTESKLGYNKGDIITVKIKEDKVEWWVTVVYMGVEGMENRNENRKLYEALMEVGERVGKQRWLVMGDFNGHIGLNNMPVNKNGDMLLDFQEKTNLKIKNWELEDPITWRDRGQESAIDYILVNEEIEKEDCRIWKNEEVDIADHIMIGITCGKVNKTNKTPRAVWKRKWNTSNRDWEKYEKELCEKLRNNYENENRTVDEWEKKTKQVIVQVAENTIGVKKYMTGPTKLKGWWDEEVETAVVNRKSKNRKQRKLWKQLAREGEQDRHEWEGAWQEYKSAKKATQIVINRKIAEWERQQAIKLNNMARGEREKEGWRRLIRNLGKMDINQRVALKMEGKVTEKDHETRSVIEKYWGPVICKATKEKEEKNITIYSDRRVMDNEGIEEREVERVIKVLKNGKAAGTDGIIGELLKYGGKAAVTTLHKIYNKVLEEGEVPLDWKKSRVTLIHKGGGKDRLDIANYRPIAVINIFAKIFGMVINEKLKAWTESHKILGEEQSGFRKGRGGLENVLTLKEIIARNKQLKKELYLVFIDIEKAYDTVNRQILIKLLRHIGVDEKIVEVIENLYNDNKVQFTLGDITTDWLQNNIGVRQGCVMSPILFNLYLEELLVRIRKSKKGVKVGGGTLGCLAYADDIVLMAESKGEMEDLLHITNTYGKEWELKFSEKKCKVMEFNTEERNQWVLGNTVLEIVDKYIYLGLEVNKEGIGEEKQRKINEGKARKMAGIIMNSGSRSINKFDVGKSLWKGVAVPYCLYGSEITKYREADITKLEIVQNTIGRWGLGAPRSTAVEALRGDMGWSSFRERIIKGKIAFIKKIESLGADRWARRVLEENGAKSTWKKEVERWKSKEQLTEDWEDMRIKDIKKKIRANGLNRWKAGMEGKSTLKWYKRKQKPEGVTWHWGDWGSKLLYKARTGTLELNGRNREVENQKCSCRTQVKETVEHFIVECDKYNGQRSTLINSVETVIGRTEWHRRLEEEDGAICTVLGLYGDSVEAERIVPSTKAFLKQCWEIRAQQGTD